MGTSMFVAVLANTALTTTISASIIADPITNPTNGHIYMLLSANTWTASQEEARLLGGNLVTVNDQAEQDWVFDVFSRAGGSGRAIWIGLHRPMESPEFQWASGELSAYTHWAPGEPNFTNEEKFVYMLPTLGGTPLAGFWNNDYDRSIGAYTGRDYSVPLFAIHGVVEIVPLPAVWIIYGGAIVAVGARSRRTIPTLRCPFDLPSC